MRRWGREGNNGTEGLTSFERLEAFAGERLQGHLPSGHQARGYNSRWDSEIAKAEIA